MTGQAGGVIPEQAVPGAGRKGGKAELDSLRERMRGRGFGHDEVAAEIGRRYRVRPREAYRLAWGWSLEEAAERVSDYSGGNGAGVGLNGLRLSELEHWPQNGRKPSVQVLFMLAEIYQTDVPCLLDFADHESLPEQDLLVLLRRPHAETPFGQRVVALMDARGLSLRDTARRIPCSPGHLSNTIHGRRRPSARVTARLEEVLAAGGELEMLAQAVKVVVPEDDQTASPRDPATLIRDVCAEAGEGFSLSLPYVPGRLVIEISGPAGNVRQIAGGGDKTAETVGRLTLVRSAAGTAAAGRRRRAHNGSGHQILG
jgi:transcriptional regulator with XRE-family HTH domain